VLQVQNESANKKIISEKIKSCDFYEEPHFKSPRKNCCASWLADSLTSLPAEVLK
jgi:hypothetical protein